MAQDNEPDKTRLTDEEWERIFSKLRTIRGIRVGVSIRCRKCVEAVLWVLRVGRQWRALPRDHGHWNSVFKRFARWATLGVWKQLHEWLAKSADLQDVSIDGTITRAHVCAAGAAKSCGENEALGRSRGGFGCKIHAVVDALGLPLKFILTGGQVADITQAIPLMESLSAQACLADKGYDSDEFVDWLKERNIKAVIPPRANRIEQRKCDWWHYKERHVVECMFGKLKYFRRIAMRYKKRPLTSWECWLFLQPCCGRDKFRQYVNRT